MTRAHPNTLCATTRGPVTHFVSWPVSLPWSAGVSVLHQGVNNWFPGGRESVLGERTGAKERGVNIGDVRRRVTAATARPACARAAASLAADGATSTLCGRTTPTPTKPSPKPPDAGSTGGLFSSAWNLLSKHQAPTEEWPLWGDWLAAAGEWAHKYVRMNQIRAFLWILHLWNVSF